MNATDTHIVIVEFYYLDDQVTAFITRSNFHKPVVFQVELSRQEIHELLREWLRLDDANRFGAGTSAHDSHPFERLFAGYVNPGDIVWIIPHDELHNIPFHTLKIGDQYLIDRNPICYSPSATLMKYCISRRGTFKDKKPAAVVLGDPNGDLPGSRVEAQAVGRALSAKPRLGGDARKSILAEIASQEQNLTLNVIHIACHGYFNDREPLKSGIAMADGLLTADDILRMKLNSNLITLSACETGINEIAEGDELMGLMRAFLYAGANSLVLSKWKVDDVAAEILMTRFYYEWQRGATKVEALRLAQVHVRNMTVGDILSHYSSTIEQLDLESSMKRTMIHQGQSKIYRLLLSYEHLYGKRPQMSLNLFAHPFFWGPFTLVGDWR
jgi:CHAT domain-containing protein